MPFAERERVLRVPAFGRKEAYQAGRWTPIDGSALLPFARQPFAVPIRTGYLFFPIFGGHTKQNRLFNVFFQGTLKKA